MADPVAFQDFGKIERLRKVLVTVTEKIDGTNAQVYVPEDPAEPVLAGSRTRWVTPPATDNFGFGAWVAANEGMLRRLGPGRHFGEWYGAGIQRGYGLKEKRLALFNVERFRNGLPEGVAEIGVDLVPVLAKVQLDSFHMVAGVIESLYTNGSVLVPGYAHPEGVIVTCCGQRWKVTDNGDEHKGQVGQLRDHVQAAAAERRAAREAELAADPVRRHNALLTVTGQPGGPYVVTHPTAGSITVQDGGEGIPKARRDLAECAAQIEADRARMEVGHA